MARHFGVRKGLQERKCYENAFWENQVKINDLRIFGGGSGENTGIEKQIGIYEDRQNDLLGKIFTGCIGYGRDPLAVYREQDHARQQELYIFKENMRFRKECKQDIRECKEDLREYRQALRARKREKGKKHAGNFNIIQIIREIKGMIKNTREKMHAVRLELKDQASQIFEA